MKRKWENEGKEKREERKGREKEGREEPVLHKNRSCAPDHLLSVEEWTTQRRTELLCTHYQSSRVNEGSSDRRRL